MPCSLRVARVYFVNAHETFAHITYFNENTAECREKHSCTNSSISPTTLFNGTHLHNAMCFMQKLVARVTAFLICTQLFKIDSMFSCDTHELIRQPQPLHQN